MKSVLNPRNVVVALVIAGLVLLPVYSALTGKVFILTMFTRIIILARGRLVGQDRCRVRLRGVHEERPDQADGDQGHDQDEPDQERGVAAQVAAEVRQPLPAGREVVRDNFLFGVADQRAHLTPPA